MCGNLIRWYRSFLAQPTGYKLSSRRDGGDVNPGLRAAAALSLGLEPVSKLSRLPFLKREWVNQITTNQRGRWSFREKGRLALLRHPSQTAEGMLGMSRRAIQPFWRKREPSYFLNRL